MTIDVRTLTTGEKAGSGIFDELMRTVHDHLANEYQAQRITGSNYADVYLGNMQSVLQVAAQYALTSQLNNKQLAILDEQINQSQQQTELLTLQKAQLQLAIDTAQYQLDNLLPAQLAQLTAQTQQVQEQTNLILNQSTQITAQTSLVGKQEDLVDEQITNEQAKHTTPTGGINRAQYDKLVVEKELGDQKVKTEKANIMDMVDGVTVTGVVGMERVLKEKQGKSFVHNAAIQNAKLHADNFAVMFSTEPEGTNPDQHGFTGTNTNTALSDAKTAFDDM